MKIRRDQRDDPLMSQPSQSTLVSQFADEVAAIARATHSLRDACGNEADETYNDQERGYIRISNGAYCLRLATQLWHVKQQSARQQPPEQPGESMQAVQSMVDHMFGGQFQVVSRSGEGFARSRSVGETEEQRQEHLQMLFQSLSSIEFDCREELSAVCRSLDANASVAKITGMPTTFCFKTVPEPEPEKAVTPQS